MRQRGSLTEVCVIAVARFTPWATAAAAAAAAAAADDDDVANDDDMMMMFTVAWHALRDVTLPVLSRGGAADSDSAWC